MFKITPPIRQNVVNNTFPIPPHTGRRVLGVLVALFFACLIVFMGYLRGMPPRPVELDRSLFYNADSLSYYMERAYTTDDPKALFITGIASHLYYADPDFPQDLPTVDPDTDGDYMLLLAAELGNKDALTYIRCLHAHGAWRHNIPQVKRRK